MADTLLRMVQDLLSEMDSDEVNSIYDSVEAEQVARVYRTCFYQLVANLTIPEHKELGQFYPLTDTNRPTTLSIPDSVKEVTEVRYRVNGRYRDIKYLKPSDFLDYINTRKPEGSNITIAKDPHSPVDILVVNDKGPTYWTSFDDKYIVFDAWDSNLENTVEATHSLGHFLKTPTFILDDDFIPDIDQHLIPLLQSEARTLAFTLLKSGTNAKLEQLARRGRVKANYRLHRGEHSKGLVDYGRRGN